MKSFCFTVDDNIRFLNELTKFKPNSMLEHPYLKMLLRLHTRFNAKIQLNLFFRSGEFDLTQMTDRYKDEWNAAAEWLKLSFHSDCERPNPYEGSGYDQVFNDCRAVNDSILRFASSGSLAKTTTVHCCKASEDGLSALRQNGAYGLLGLWGNDDTPRVSYNIDGEAASRLRNGETVFNNGITYAAIDMIVNQINYENIEKALSQLLCRDSLRIMIHEQYFYADYRAYQPNFEDKLTKIFQTLTDNGYKSVFFEELI